MEIFMYGYFCEREYGGDFSYTDLASERRRADTDIQGVDYRRESSSGGTWERIKITSDEGAKSIGRPKGVYDTLEVPRMDLLDLGAIDDAKEEIAKELCYMCDILDVIPDRILVVGLGNPALTPDSIGPESAKRVKATMHIGEFDKEFFSSLECSEIAVITPSVASVSGMDAMVSILGVAGIIKPDVVIAIDALASRSGERLGRTIQVTNTGIHPGSGLGNSRRYLSQSSLGVPVIALGVPTVIDARMLSAGLGTYDGEHGRVTSKSPAMFVSPKEINEIVTVGAEIIGGAINQAFGLFC